VQPTFATKSALSRDRSRLVQCLLLSATQTSLFHNIRCKNPLDHRWNIYVAQAQERWHSQSKELVRPRDYYINPNRNLPAPDYHCPFSNERITGPARSGAVAQFAIGQICKIGADVGVGRRTHTEASGNEAPDDAAADTMALDYGAIRWLYRIDRFVPRMAAY
jgi:hypothetical protein